MKLQKEIKMTIEDAILRIAELRAQLPSVKEEGRYGHRFGKVFINDGTVQRGLAPCPHCGRAVGMGLITVMHADGRMVGFKPRLHHYVQEGHPITNEDIDGETLIAILADA